MKKRLVIALAFALLLSLTACGGQAGNVQPPEDPPSGNSQQPDPTPDTGPQPDQQPSPSQPEDSDPVQTPDEDGGAPAAGDETETESQTNSQPAPDPEPTQDPEPTPAPDPEPTPDPEPDPAPEPTPDPTPEASPEDLKAIAQGLIGRPVSELYDAIGQPLSADYSPSCLDLDTDDGELTYDGFVVYTAGAPDNEVVYDVF